MLLWGYWDDLGRSGGILGILCGLEFPEPKLVHFDFLLPDPSALVVVESASNGVAKDVSAATTVRVRWRRHGIPWAGRSYKHVVILRAGAADQSRQQYRADED